MNNITERDMQVANAVRRAQLKIVREGLQGGRWIEDIDDAVSKVDIAAIIAALPAVEDMPVAEVSEIDDMGVWIRWIGDAESTMRVGTKLYSRPQAAAQVLDWWRMVPVETTLEMLGRR